MKILITGGKSAAALKLIRAFAGDEVVLADYGEVPVFASAAYSMISLGEKNEEVTAHQLLNICLDQEIEMLIPIHYFEVAAISKSTVLFEEFNIKVLLPEMSALPVLLSDEKLNAVLWAVYREGELLYASAEGEIPVVNYNGELNGVFHLSETGAGLTPVLYTIIQG